MRWPFRLPHSVFVIPAGGILPNVTGMPPTVRCRPFSTATAIFAAIAMPILKLMRDLTIDPDRTPFVPVPHHLTHASSAYHLSGFDGKVAILGIDGKGEYATTFFGYGEKGQIHCIKEFFDPDSLGGVYGALTQYLGFEMLDGEFKVMGMAPYGDPTKYDFSPLIQCDGRSFTVDTTLVNTVGLRRYKQDGLGFYFSPKLVDWLGPKREGDEIDDPYVDYAASMQKLLEDVASAADRNLPGRYPARNR
jgi:carbamoyltransferase